MEQHDIHEGVGLEDSLQYREQCQKNYWDAMDRVECARIALAAINNHIQDIGTKRPSDGVSNVTSIALKEEVEYNNDLQTQV